MTCTLCELWVAKSWRQYRVRQANMKGHPDIKAYACPTCGGRDWATKLPALPPEPPLLDDSAGWRHMIPRHGLGADIVAGTLIIAAAMMIFMLYARHAHGAPNCGSGYYLSGDFCVPLDKRRNVDAIPRGKSVNCPSGFYLSGDFCVPLERPKAKGR